jgi:hypothetical protein
VLSFLNASPSIAEEVTPISPHQGLWQTWTVTPGSLLRPLDPSGGTPFAIDNTVGNHGIDQTFHRVICWLQPTLLRDKLALQLNWDTTVHVQSGATIQIMLNILII